MQHQRLASVPRRRPLQPLQDCFRDEKMNVSAQSSNHMAACWVWILKHNAISSCSINWEVLQGVHSREELAATPNCSLNLQQSPQGGKVLRALTVGRS